MSFRRNLSSVVATFALSLSLLLLVQCSEMGSWDLFKVQTIFSAFEKRMKLTFLNSGQGEDLIDFPVLVILTPLRLDYSHVKANGSDILFIDRDASTRLDYEIETWNPGGTSSLWVRVPEVEGSTNSDHIWMYYNGGEDEEYQNPAGVWNSGYVGVWHLSEGGTGTRLDSSPFANHGSLRITGQVTLSAWFKLADGEYNGYVRLLTKKPRFDSAFGYGIWMHPNNEWVAILAAADNQARADLVGDQLDSGWHYVMCTISGEIRIENVARSADWAKAQYLAMTDAFIVYGPEESIR